MSLRFGRRRGMWLLGWRSFWFAGFYRLLGRILRMRLRLRELPGIRVVELRENNGQSGIRWRSAERIVGIHNSAEPDARLRIRKIEAHVIGAFNRRRQIGQRPAR